MYVHHVCSPCAHVMYDHHVYTHVYSGCHTKRTNPATAVDNRSACVVKAPTSSKRKNRKRGRVEVDAKSIQRRRARRKLSLVDEEAPKRMDFASFIKLSKKQESMVYFFRSKLRSDLYKFRLTKNTQHTRNMTMHGCVFNADDVAEFATYGKFCTSDLVKVSAMCTYEAMKASSVQGKHIGELMVLQDSEVQLLLQDNECDSLALDVWTHINQAGNVLAAVLSRPRGVHYVGVFVRKVRDRHFEINARNSATKIGGHPKRCVQHTLCSHTHTHKTYTITPARTCVSVTHANTHTHTHTGAHTHTQHLHTPPPPHTYTRTM